MKNIVKDLESAVRNVAHAANYLFLQSKTIRTTETTTVLEIPTDVWNQLGKAIKAWDHIGSRFLENLFTKNEDSNSDR